MSISPKRTVDITLGKVKCIVTAGPTFEELDEVRRLTNFSTGSLGTSLANFLSGHGHSTILIKGQSATSQIQCNASRFLPFTTTADLQRKFRDLATNERIAIFHAAAVSDFTFGKIWERHPDGSLTQVHGAKISTRGGELLAELKPTPKILAALRDWFPNALIVGWKYELEGDKSLAIACGERQLSECRSDACIVNGRAYGGGFGWVSREAPVQHLANQAELFQALERFIAPSR